jgi:hypothetical protein
MNADKYLKYLVQSLSVQWMLAQICILNKFPDSSQKYPRLSACIRVPLIIYTSRG